MVFKLVPIYAPITKGAQEMCMGIFSAPRTGCVVEAGRAMIVIAEIGRLRRAA
jgi:hypothetical protein